MDPHLTHSPDWEWHGFLLRTGKAERETGLDEDLNLRKTADYRKDVSETVVEIFMEACYFKAAASADGITGRVVAVQHQATRWQNPEIDLKPDLI